MNPEELTIYQLYTEYMIEDKTELDDSNETVSIFLSEQDEISRNIKKKKSTTEIEAAKLLQFLTMMKNSNVTKVRRNIKYLKEYVARRQA